MTARTRNRRIIWGVVAAIVLFQLILGFRTADATGNGQEKITICHHTSSETNPTVTITIAIPAYEAHVANHGDGEFDTEGECPVEETTTTTAPEEVTTTTVGETTTTTGAPPIVEPTTTTTLPFDHVPTTTSVPVVTTTTQPNGPNITELPYTGISPWFLAFLALGLAAMGGLSLGISAWRNRRY